MNDEEREAHRVEMEARVALLANHLQEFFRERLLVAEEAQKGMTDAREYNREAVAQAAVCMAFAHLTLHNVHEGLMDDVCRIAQSMVDCAHAQMDGRVLN